MKRSRRYLLYDLFHACVLAGGLIVLLTACRTAQHSDLSPEIADRTETVEAEPDDGFSWPYLLYTPAQLRPEPRPILVLSLNSPQPHDDYQHHWRQAVNKVDQYRSLADELGAPLLIGAFPRFLHRIPVGPGKTDFDLPEVEDYEPSWVIGVQSLNRNSLITPNRYLARPDLQILAMVRDARLRLDERGVATHPRIVPIGFSSSGTFALRLALLHPEHVLAVAAGAPGGYYPLAVTDYNGVSLDYPLGIADITRFSADFDHAQLARVPIFVFAGGDDPDDSVPYLDAYTYEDRVVIENLLGTDPIGRYRRGARIWRDTRRNHPASAPFTLTVYPGIGHTFTAEMREDVVHFIDLAVERAIHTAASPAPPLGRKGVFR